MLLKLFQKTQRKRILLKSFYEASITLIPKPHKDTSEKKVIKQYNILDEQRCENL
jgi:hypothetical protein